MIAHVSFVPVSFFDSLCVLCPRDHFECKCVLCPSDHLCESTCPLFQCHFVITLEFCVIMTILSVNMSCVPVTICENPLVLCPSILL